MKKLLNDALRACPDCGASVGRSHTTGCDIEQCPSCGGQAISCGCSDEEFYAYDPLLWTGEYPGSEECRVLGWYSVFKGGEGWLRCGPETTGAAPDLNRFAVEAVWSPAERCYYVDKKRIGE